MKKIAFLFPGQGSQEVGMGMDISEKYPVAGKVFEKTDELFPVKLSELIKNGPTEDLKLTINTQPAVVAASIAMLEAVRESGVDCLVAAGHSVGEFAALYCAGVLSLSDCLVLTRSRGEYMHEAGEKYPGTLSAIIGLDVPAIEEICKKVSEDGVVVVANLNCPGQTVISGDLESVEKAGVLAKEAGAMKVVPLAVSAAFHSPLMEEAAVKLARKIDEINFNDAKIPVYCNVTGEPVTSGNEIKNLMKKQITGRVYWEKAIRKMLEDGVDTFIEIGPGKALAGMLKRIDRSANVMNVYNLDTLSAVVEKLSGSAVRS